MNVYIAAMDTSNRVIMLQPNGQWLCPSASNPSAPQPIIAFPDMDSGAVTTRQLAMCLVLPKRAPSTWSTLFPLSADRRVAWYSALLDEANKRGLNYQACLDLCPPSPADESRDHDKDENGYPRLCMDPVKCTVAEFLGHLLLQRRGSDAAWSASIYAEVAKLGFLTPASLAMFKSPA